MSVNTLRTHTKHIFTKLDVNTRRAAVTPRRRARPALSRVAAGGSPPRSHRMVMSASPRRFLAFWLSPEHPGPPPSKEPAMTITTTGLTQAAGIAAAVAGAIFIAVQINHPAMDVASVDDHRVGRPQHRQDRHGRPRAGRHHRHVPAPARQVGVLGLVGYLLFSAGYLAHVRHRVHGRVRPADPGRRPRPATSTTSSSPPRWARRPATSARCRPSSPSPASATSLGGLIFGIATVPRRRPRPLGGRPARRRHRRHRWPSPCCPSRSTGRWPSPTASR